MVGTNLVERFCSGKGEGAGNFRMGLPHSQTGNQLAGEGQEVVKGSSRNGETLVLSGSASSSSNSSLLRQSLPLPTPYNWCNPVHPPAAPSSSSAFSQGAAMLPPLPLTLSGLAAPGGAPGDASWDSNFLPLMSSLGLVNLLIRRRLPNV